MVRKMLYIHACKYKLVHLYSCVVFKSCSSHSEVEDILMMIPSILSRRQEQSPPNFLSAKWMSPSPVFFPPSSEIAASALPFLCQNFFLFLLFLHLPISSFLEQSLIYYSLQFLLSPLPFPFSAWKNVGKNEWWMPETALAIFTSDYKESCWQFT